MSFEATEYFRIDPRLPELVGPYNGEFINYDGTQFAHLAHGFTMPEASVGKRYAREDTDAIVVEGVSRHAFDLITRAVAEADANTKREVMDVIVGLLYIGWDIPHQDIGRINAMKHMKEL